MGSRHRQEIPDGRGGKPRMQFFRQFIREIFDTRSSRVSRPSSIIIPTANATKLLLTEYIRCMRSADHGAQYPSARDFVVTHQ